MRGPRLLLVLLLLTAFTLTILDVRAGEGSVFDGVRRGADAVLGPAQRAVGGAAESLSGVFGGDVDEAELRRLRDENARLRGDLVRSEAAQRRAAELDALLALQDAGTYTVVPARVTAVGSAFGFELTVTIDAGSRDGIRSGQTVVNGDGLVGRTTRVGPFTSTVLLLTDPGFTVGARLTREGTVGLATGDGADALTYELVEGGRVQEDEALLTTGSSTFVPGVPVGRVTSVDAGGGLVTRARVEPFADVASLDLVGVVTEPPRGTPRVPIPPRMTGRRLLLGTVTLGTALLLQTAVLARLPLPGGIPDLLLVVVVAFALVEGPLSGTVNGFVAGLLADLASDHELGRVAFVYALVGYLVGLLHDDRPRSFLLPFAAVAGAAATAVTVYALEGLLLGDPRITSSAFWPSLAGTVTYCVVLTPLVVPVVGALVRRQDRDPFRR